MHKRVTREELDAQSRSPVGGAIDDVRERLITPGALLIAGVAFAAYLLSAFYLGARGGLAHFGADPEYYSLMDRLAYDYTAARFHPSTVLLGLGWMKLLSPLWGWIAPQVLLKAMFAAVGAVGVLGAIMAFRLLLPRGYGLLAGALYASSLGVWYFAAIPESKILTASLSTLYIAVYVLYRDDWTLPRTLALNTILAIACINEIVAGFLVAIPAMDALLRGLTWSRVRWIAVQVVVGIVALVALEVFVNGWLVPESKDPAEHSHFALFFAYFARFTLAPAKLHDFASSWFFFNLVAPTPYALWWTQYGGYFEPSVLAYLASPMALATICLIAAMMVVGVVDRVRGANFGPADGLLLPLAAYAVVRAIFFILFVPNEALLFSPAVTLPHWLFVLVPFLASRFPAKKAVLAAVCALMIFVNASFMAGPQGWPAFWTWMVGS